MIQKHQVEGMTFLQFEDVDGRECTINQSSLAEADALWVGVSTIPVKPRDMPDLEKQGAGYRLPMARMHLTKGMARDLMRALARWIEHDEIEAEQ